MAASATPANQIIALDPYEGKLFDFDTTSSRVYLSRYINNLLKILGTDLVLEGLNVVSSTYNHANDIITVVISNGKCIADCTLIEFPSNITLTLDTTPYATGYLFITIHYQFLESIYTNLSKLKLFYSTLDGVSTFPESISPHLDRIVLAVIDLNKENKTATLNTSLNEITLMGTTYEIRPLSLLAKDSLNYLKKMIVCQ